MHNAQLCNLKLMLFVTGKPDLENGYYKEHQKGEFEYACDDGHVSNIPRLQKMRFRCEFIASLGDFELKATSSRFHQPFGPIYLRNITCQRKYHRKQDEI